MPDDSKRAVRLTRRGLLQTAGGAAAAAGLASLPACGPSASRKEQLATAAERVDAPQLPPLPPSQLPPGCDVLSFFSVDEARAVAAFAERLVPGAEDDPGATDACVTRYIDLKLAEFDAFATPTYHEPPFPEPAGNRPPGFEDDAVYVAEDQLERYGFQSSLTPQDAYRQGIEQLETYTRAAFGTPFAELPAVQQDDTIEKLEADGLTQYFADPGGKAFFTMVQEDTMHGLFADPAYGGNRDFVGWRLIRYPGIQRAYTPSELTAGPNERRIQGLKDLAPLHPGRVQEHAILPVQGTERY